MKPETHSQVESQLSQLDPAIELVAVEPSGPESLRIYIDHPDGVDLSLCERVTVALSDLRDRYSLEISSPGANRPLTRPEHFRRFVGSRAKIRTSVEVEGRRGFTGTITSATDTSVELALPEGPVRIPHESIHRSNLVPETA
jgi:ribosome maturation factor RimP